MNDWFLRPLLCIFNLINENKKYTEIKCLLHSHLEKNMPSSLKS